MKKDMRSKRSVRVIALLLVLALSACGAQPAALSYGSSETLTLSDTDYSDTNNWLSFGGDGSYAADVFLIYPTVTAGESEADLPFVRLESQAMRDGAKAYLDWAGGIVEESANIYAPYYRMASSLMISNDREEMERLSAGLPREDVFAAFDYYLKNINKGERPFIVFGFSQGAAMAIEVATSFLGNEEYYEYNKNHVITYAIGFAVTPDQITKNPNLKFSERGDDVGVIVSWNTMAPSEIASGAYANFGTWRPGALVTNPISWSPVETLAHASDNKASMVAGEDGTVRMVENYANALVDNEHNALVVTTVDESQYLSRFAALSIFHGADIRFFYDSIKQNVKDRIDAFTAK